MAKKTTGTRGSRSRRGKSESMTGAKEGAVEKRQVEAPLQIASADKIIHHMKHIKGWKEKLTTIQGQLRNAYKSAKADNVLKATLDTLLGLERGDAIAYRAEMEALSVGLKAVGAPFQLSVFDVAYGSDVEQAKADARAAANAGRGFECKFPEGSEAYDAASAEWMRINAERVPGGEDLTDEDIDAAIAAGQGEARQMELAH